MEDKKNDETPLPPVMPTYLLLDQSYSMSGAPIDALNEALIHIRDAASDTPSLREVVHIAIIGFSDHARAHMELTALSDDLDMPVLMAESGTSFGSAFAALINRIPGEIDALKAQGYKVHRPLALFLSDGEPTDSGWEQTLASLMELKGRPNILAFGIGDYNAESIRTIASKPEYALGATTGGDVGKAVAEFGTALLTTLMTSADSVAQGNAPVATIPEGFEQLMLETEIM